MKTKQSILKLYIENNLSDDDLLKLFRAYNGYFGDYEFCDTWDLEELCFSYGTYDIARKIIFGNVNNIVDDVRFDENGNLESIDNYDLYDEMYDYLGDLCNDLLNNWYKISDDIEFINRDLKTLLEHLDCREDELYVRLSDNNIAKDVLINDIPFNEIDDICDVIIICEEVDDDNVVFIELVCNFI